MRGGNCFRKILCANREIYYIIIIYIILLLYIRVGIRLPQNAASWQTAAGEKYWTANASCDPANKYKINIIR
jgi:hypothetical protein